MIQDRRNWLGFLVVLGTFLLGVWVVKLLFNIDAQSLLLNRGLKNLKESVVHIETGIGKDKWYGTGFFVASDKVATNIHVVAPQRPIIMKKVGVNNTTLPLVGIKSIESVNKEVIGIVEGVTAFDVKNDLVILKVNAFSTPFPIGNSKEIKVNEPITTMGFPNRRFSFSKGRIYNIEKSGRRLQIKINLGGGSSGSPVLNKKGEVIGIHPYSNSTLGYSLTVPSNNLRVLLTQSEKIESLAEWRQRDEIRSYAHHVHGRIKFDKGEYKKAISEFNKALKLNTESIYSYYKRGDAKLEQGLLEVQSGRTQQANDYFIAAVNDFTDAIKIDSENADAYLLRGTAKFELGNRKQAISDFENAIMINPMHTQLFYYNGFRKSNLGQNELMQGNAKKAQRFFVDAIFYYKIAIERTPKSSKVYRKVKEIKDLLRKSKDDRFIVELSRKSYEEIVQFNTQRIKSSPKHMGDYSGRGYSYYFYGKFESDQGNIARSQKLYEAAIKDFSSAIRFSKFKSKKLKNTDVYNIRGSAEIELGKIETNRGNSKKAINLYESAIEDFDQVIKVNSGYAKAYYKRGIAKEALGRKEEAKADFEKAKELYPNVGK